MKYSLLLFLIFQPLFFCQPFPPKQITNLDFDSKNVSYIVYPYNMPWNTDTEIFFEGIRDTSSDIYTLTYNAQTDSFFNLIKISSGKSLNQHLSGKLDEGSKFILWETYKNGNWDIVYSIKLNNQWTPEQYLVNTGEDEFDASFVFHPYDDNSYYFDLVYTRGNDIVLLSKDTTEEILFNGNDSVQYSNPAMIANYDNDYAVAEKRINNSEPFLVIKKKNKPDSLWTEESFVYSEGMSENPTFITIDWTTYLVFEAKVNNKNRILWIDMDTFEGPYNRLISDETVETSNFTSMQYYIITTQASGQAFDYNSSFPYSFKYIKNDSAFIRSGLGNFYQSVINFNDIYTSVKDAQPNTSAMGHNKDGFISYTIWEDSSNGKINLFGLKRIDILGETVHDTRKMGFSLSQNYPNPFNPYTKIKYAIGSSQYAMLKVYDILGNEITTLVNEEKPAGEYEVEFNGAGLASGIYFYTLRVGNYIRTYKAILLK